MINFVYISAGGVKKFGSNEKLEEPKDIEDEDDSINNEDDEVDVDDMTDDKNVDNGVDDESYVAKDNWNFDDLIDDGFSVMTTEGR